MMNSQEILPILVQFRVYFMRIKYLLSPSLRCGSEAELKRTVAAAILPLGCQPDPTLPRPLSVCYIFIRCFNFKWIP